MSYLESYEEYVSLGGKAPGADFLLLECQERKRIDYVTKGRVAAMKEIPMEVKLCMVSLMNLEYKAGTEAQIDSPTVTSVTTDGYSESYGKAMGANDIRTAQETLIWQMLYGLRDDKGMPLLYRGVR